MQDLTQTGRGVSFSWSFLLILKLSYLTGEGKMNLSDFLNFTNQPKSNPFANLHVHFLQALLFAKEKKEKESQGACAP